ncbi:glutamine-hydrolyzing carbamoyl-phosphate synthase small subunit [Carboxydochorda subterranea]|uniref:Carbamoyl phosphate synthase small chain n=1 Tax=Carboxydichorda subterranea TaxID=3109565 RepID=A0ABZ1BZX4_9FIRM|nr:glutamine-hydrolyzing carbamoyl-phosphate synthase small subunit [Limnochorda sp. L945t]WRP18386.1 glutamine-hydrolyzing carbamoyl-phosphate synthase small subunit [Limnochorda sp. L945t]
MRTSRRPAWLALEDGAVYEGEAIGRAADAWGEVVFTTVVTGYQEVLTDPSYRGQIVVFTQPLVGNYGTFPGALESSRAQVNGVIMRELCDLPDAHPGAARLEQWLVEQGIPGLSGVDTRALTRRLRSRGAMRGVISAQARPARELIEAARRVPGLSEQPLVEEVSAGEPYHVGTGPGPRVVVVDLGVKRHIVTHLVQRGCRVTVVPSRFTAGEIRALHPDGVVLSNGPGDPAVLDGPIATARELCSSGIPIFGICLGHQILALALGGSTYKLKFGHRGGNHPVKDLETGRVFITTHNHGYAVDEAQLPPDLIVTHRSLNDGTVEGLRHRSLPVWSVQYHPEATPGPQESAYLFDRFVGALRRAAGGDGRLSGKDESAGALA